MSKLIVLLLFMSFFACEKEGISIEDTTTELREPDCETAFAYDKDAMCFLNEPNLNANRWGWSIGPLQAPLNTSYPIYQAAGQCNLDNGQLIGRLYVSYIGTTLTVDYVAYDGFGFYETHFYVGNEKYPRKRNGQFTVAPGQYPFSHSFPNGAIDDNFKVDRVSGKIFIIAHAVVCPYIKKDDDVN